MPGEEGPRTTSCEFVSIRVDSWLLECVSVSALPFRVIVRSFVNERTKKLEAVFHAAMDLASAEERERYLNHVCGGDLEFRREVDELLKSAATADAVFQAGREACRVAEAVPAGVLTEKPGDRIGRYKLLEKIGEGGASCTWPSRNNRSAAKSRSK